jgi:methionyl-tRNA synthetase
MKQKTVITAALPYANAPLHIGHMVEYVQADIYARFLKLIGENALYICASDMHGTPIEVKAQENKTTPKKYAQKYHQLNKETFKKYLINFDNYYHTDSKENQELANQFFNILNKKGYIYKKNIEVIYCPKCERNLPDRYVKGTCPNCGAYDQYGDICEKCSLILKGTDLINPKCSVCQTSPTKKRSEHYFFRLKKFENKLKTWIKKTHLQPEIKNSIKEWLNKGLEDWCISRDGPYFGFKIPKEKNKYFYVWLDAPIGYISSTKNYTDKWQDYWKKGKIIHIIGKDIIYFHFLFWPAMLLAANFKPPTDIIVHGFLTVNGQKMSKSRGTFFTAEDFLKLYPPEHLRFYYAQHLSRKLSDLDMDFEDFKATINNRLVANLANFCYRTLSFANENYKGRIISYSEPKLEKEINVLIKKIEKNYLEFNFKEAIANILKISDLGNVYFQKAQPWKDITNSHKEVSFCVNLVRNLAILIKPVLPDFSKKIDNIFNEKNQTWKELNFNFTGKINKPKILVQKIDKLPEAAVFPLDLKVGKITKVEDHPKADLLYVLQIDFKKEKKQAVAGLKKYFDKETLKNKKAVFCMNIKPAKLRGIESNCMILAAFDGRNISLLETEQSNPGDEVTLEGHKNNKQQVTFEDFKKIKMEIRNNQVFHQTKHLKTAKEAISVRGVKDGAVIE